MKIILSIKPEFANKIFEGIKKFEFRRSLFKNKDVNKVVVYASAPISKVIGEFEIDDILHHDLSKLWLDTQDFAGISEEYYLKYFDGKEQGFAIKIKNAKLYNSYKCIKESFGISPPQSFAYVRKETKKQKVALA